MCGGADSRRAGQAGPRVGGLCTLLAGALLLAGCSAMADATGPRQPDEPAGEASRALPAPPQRPPAEPSASKGTREQSAAEPVQSQRPGRAQRPKRPEPRRSFLRIPAIGVVDVPVLRYRGSPDDAAGTRIQNRGPTASPRGPRGGVGPGDVGNFIVTGHRTSHSAPFADLPVLRAGDVAVVRSGGHAYTYRVTRTRWTSFRSPRSLAAQSAEVPGRPGRKAVRPWLTLSTCATPEDHANGNYWSDRFGNPEHRIDKIAALVDVRPAGPASG